MTCCGNPSLSSTTNTPPPPVGANGCLVARYLCCNISGIPTWVLDSSYAGTCGASPPGGVQTGCVANNLCSGQVSCTPHESVIELVNGCVIGNPLPTLVVPWCTASGCAPASTTTTTTTTPPPPNIPAGAKLVLVPSSIQSSGGVVTGWDDISGYGNNLAAFGAPTLGNIGSKPAVSFNGTTAYMQSPTNAVHVDVTEGFTQFILMVSNTGLQDLLYNGDVGTGEFVTALKAGANVQSELVVTEFGESGIALNTNANTPAGQAIILWGRGQNNGVNDELVAFGQSGDATVSGSFGYTDVPPTNGRITVGNSYPLGDNSFSGLVNCIIEYDRNLSDTEVAQVLAAMAAFAT